MPLDVATGLARILTRHPDQFRGLTLGMTIEQVAKLEGKKLVAQGAHQGEEIHKLERAITKTERDQLVVSTLEGRVSEIEYFLTLDSKEEIAAIFKALLAAFTERFGKGTKDGAFTEFELPTGHGGADARLWTGKYAERSHDGPRHVIKVVVDPR